MVASVSLLLDRFDVDSFSLEGCQDDAGIQFLRILMGVKIPAVALAGALQEIERRLPGVATPPDVPEAVARAAPGVPDAGEGPADAVRPGYVVKNTFVTVAEQAVPRLTRTTTAPAACTGVAGDAAHPGARGDELHAHLEEEWDDEEAVHKEDTGRDADDDEQGDEQDGSDEQAWPQEASASDGGSREHLRLSPSARTQTYDPYAYDPAAAMVHPHTMPGVPMGLPFAPPPFGLMPSPWGMIPPVPWYQAEGWSFPPPLVEEAMEPTGVPEAASPARSQAVQESFNVALGCMQLRWTVSADVLQRSDLQQVESGTFDISFDRSRAPFRMRLRPDGDPQGGEASSFQAAGGIGFVEVCCMESLQDNVPHVKFNVAVGRGAHRQTLHQPVLHNFADRPTCELPAARWDFAAAVDSDSGTFDVCLEVLPTRSAAITSFPQNARLAARPPPPTQRLASAREEEEEEEVDVERDKEEEGEEDEGGAAGDGEGDVKGAAVRATGATLGPNLIVKNTFLDVMEGPSASAALARTSTAPPQRAVASGDGESGQAAQHLASKVLAQLSSRERGCSATIPEGTEDILQPDPAGAGAGAAMRRAQQARGPRGGGEEEGVAGAAGGGGGSSSSSARAAGTVVAAGGLLDRTETKDAYSYDPADQGTWIDRAAEGEDAGPAIGAEQLMGMMPMPPVVNFLQHEPPPVKPQMLHRTYDPVSASLRLEWVVSARKLSSTDPHPHVSPAFDLNFGEVCPSAPFKMLIYPLVVSDKKGGASFKKAGGRGYVELACEKDLPPTVPEVTFFVTIGSGERRLARRGPVAHNFYEKAVCGLPKRQALWDFNLAVDKVTQTFVVCLEIQSGVSAPTATEPEVKKPGHKRW